MQEDDYSDYDSSEKDNGSVEEDVSLFEEGRFTARMNW